MLVIFTVLMACKLFDNTSSTLSYLLVDLSINIRLKLKTGEYCSILCREHKLILSIGCLFSLLFGVVFCFSSFPFPVFVSWEFFQEVKFCWNLHRIIRLHNFSELSRLVCVTLNTHLCVICNFFESNLCKTASF